MPIWNHNTAYRPCLVSKLKGSRSLLDVGSGDHSFADLAGRQVAHVDVVDPLINTTFEEFQPTQSYDAITFIASLHHMNAEEALNKAVRILNPGGKLLIVGLAKNKTASDWIISGLQALLSRPISLINREQQIYPFPTKEPSESLHEIRQLTKQLLPHRRIRRGIHFRYLLKWTKP
ncbi:methyltransferase domain-containing protein [Corynebacterium glutamicum]|uniref:class I SAM-dependent methyltransferase n=1 Tax=Corynebacterium glutamicum TaxID=1718 RepID=UPI001C6E6957|nr:methyltransferase domain-containing protein [Corynebacterium glutamicum]QYR17078.1 methyltransferase domain-containing protein [Corynebacterium glutamicum]